VSEPQPLKPLPKKPEKKAKEAAQPSRRSTRSVSKKPVRLAPAKPKSKPKVTERKVEVEEPLSERVLAGIGLLEASAELTSGVQKMEANSKRTLKAHRTAAVSATKEFSEGKLTFKGKERKAFLDTMHKADQADRGVKYLHRRLNDLAKLVASTNQKMVDHHLKLHLDASDRKEVQAKSTHSAKQNKRRKLAKKAKK
jgi:hypothetical protein